MTAAPLAIVSGASGGIGRAVAEALWKAGYSLVLLGRHHERLCSCTAMLSTRPHASTQLCYALAMAFPTTGWQQLRTVVTSYEGLGGTVEVVAVCHGADPTPGAFLTPAQTDAERSLAHVWDVDVVSAAQLCRVLVPSMVAQRHGSLCFIASSHSRLTYPERTVYAAVKSGVCGLMRGLAVELGPDNITANAICPWQVDGARTQRFIDVAAREGVDLRERYAARVPLRRLVDVEDIASLVVWLVRQRSMTGQELHIDAGLGATGWHQPFVGED